jgi:hypothetical protein
VLHSPGGIKDGAEYANRSQNSSHQENKRHSPDCVDFGKQ